MHPALKRLIENGWLDEIPPSAPDIRALLSIVDRNLDEAQGALKYADTRFSLAYSAVLAAATVVLRGHGVRVRRQRHHERTFGALRLLELPGISDRATYYDDCRRKRNVMEYDSAGSVSDREGQELLQEALRFVAAVGEWLRQSHPELA